MKTFNYLWISFMLSIFISACGSYNASNDGVADGMTKMETELLSDIELKTDGFEPTLSPEFASNIVSYTVQVPYDITNIQIKSTATDPNSSISLNSENIKSADWSNLIDLNVGVNVVEITVTTDTITSETKTYTLNIARLESGNTNLSDLSVENNPIAPSFDVEKYIYSVSVSQSFVNIVATVEDAGASVKIADKVSESGVAQKVDIENGINTIEIIVTAANGLDKQTYYLIINRGTSNSELSTLSFTGTDASLSPAFDPNISNYILEVESSLQEINVVPTVSDTEATVFVNNQEVNSGEGFAIDLDSGINAIKIKVISSDYSSIRTYSVDIYRAEG